jgi:hypothetical protein
MTSKSRHGAPNAASAVASAFDRDLRLVGRLLPDLKSLRHVGALLFFLYVGERGRFSAACDRRHMRIKTYAVMNGLPRCLVQKDVDLCQRLRTALPLRLA